MKFLEKIKHVISTKPPVVCFVVCLGMVSIAFVSLAYHINSHNIKDLTISKNWNTILSNITSINFWSQNTSITHHSTVKKLQETIKHSTKASFKLNSFIKLPRLHSYTFPSDLTFESVINSSAIQSSGDTNIIMFLQALNDKDISIKNELALVPMCMTVFGEEYLLPSIKSSQSCSFRNSTSKNYLQLHSKSINLSLPSLSLNLTHPLQEDLYIFLSKEKKQRIKRRLIKSSFIVLAFNLLVIIIALFKTGKGSNQPFDQHSLLMSS